RAADARDLLGRPGSHRPIRAGDDLRKKSSGDAHSRGEGTDWRPDTRHGRRGTRIKEEQSTMSLRINQNIAAMNAYRNLSVSDSQMAKSLEKLSSGFRINRAADDAAGLSISENLR